MMNRVTLRQYPHGFTLVELLVVIAIISVLAAMLLPSLTDAMAMSLRTSCLSQEKQLGLALNMYANNSQEYYPRSPECRHYSSRPGNNAGFFTASIGYSAPRYGQFHKLWPDYVTGETFICPGISYRGSMFTAMRTNNLTAPSASQASGYTYIVDGYVRFVVQGKGYTSTQALTALPADFGSWGPIDLRAGKDIKLRNGTLIRKAARVALLSCSLGDSADGGTHYGDVNAVTIQQWGINWDLAGHRAGDPQGTNILLGDGSAKWLDIGINRWVKGYTHAFLGDAYHNVAVPE